MEEYIEDYIQDQGLQKTWIHFWKKAEIEGVIDMYMIELNNKYVKYFNALKEQNPKSVTVLSVNGFLSGDNLAQIILTLTPAILIAVPAILHEIYEASNKRKESIATNREEISVKRKLDNGEFELILKVNPSRIDKETFSKIISTFVESQDVE